MALATGAANASRTDPPKADASGGPAEPAFAIQAPSITLPKGGGAIRGIGEKFAANPVTGTGSMSVPIATSPGRSGFGPQLSLAYDSGAGNGPFGFGWSLSLPSITRKTDKGLPQYLDSIDSDVFVLSGAEDLVPLLQRNAAGEWIPESVPSRMVGQSTYRIRRYRPRVEGLFARIERWTNEADASDVFWRSISKDNITTWYGKTAESRIADPSDPQRIFSWLICQSHDDKGNVIVYGYQAEDSARVFEDASGKSVAKAHERNRDDSSRSAQRYLKRVRYGNRLPYLPQLTQGVPWPEPSDAHAPDGSNSWLFEPVFDYGDHPDPVAPTPAASVDWSLRPDPFSSYRAGFEVRTMRRCQRVLMFHHFPDEPEVGANCLVRSTDFTYSDTLAVPNLRAPVYTFLQAVTQTGYRRGSSGYLSSSLPPVEFEYTKPEVQDVIEEIDPASLENLPVGLGGSAYRWTDLHGEGIPGILTEQASAWFYKRNWSPLPEKQPGGREVVRAKFAPLETVALRPNLTLSAGADFMDLAGDGQPDVVVTEGPTPGLYEHDEAEGWQLFRPFTSRLNRPLRDPNLKFADLDGDGHADVLITEDDAFVWHASLAEEGFGPARRVVQALDEEKGPRIVFADGTQSIYLADLSGDGLTDLVRIRNGNVCYWPNLGYGRFGAKVTMDNAPWFDEPDQFDHKRIRLADIDGSGTTDIIYLHRDGVRLYFNQSGNSWSEPEVLRVFPRIDDLASIMPVDLLGDGTACLVWSSPLPGDATRPMRYVNLMGRRKPHLLFRTVNNLGAETRVDYAPSTRFYLQDKFAGRPWATRLPFPVHVVERVETYDHISRNRFVTRYAYHHGYFDGEEREFRGFGMVEQWDTASFAALSGANDVAAANVAAANIAADSHVPPVHTKTWFHTGAYLAQRGISRHFEGEYFLEGLAGEAARALLLEDTVLPPGLTAEEEREACRTLKGSMLRQEVYADDADHPSATAQQIERARVPYSVTEQNFTIRALQPRGAQRHAVYFTHPREAISYHYERNPSDPRTQHALTLRVDDFGNVLEQATVGYGRRRPDTSLPTDEDRRKQALVHITVTANDFTNAIPDEPDQLDDYRAPLPAGSRTYELRKAIQEQSAPGLTRRHAFEDLLGHSAQAGDGQHDIAYEDIEFSAAKNAVAANPAEANKYFRRIIEHARTLYRPDDCGASLGNPDALQPLGQLQARALPGESYKLAFTPGLLAQVFQRPHADPPSENLLPNPAAVLGGQGSDQGGYVQSQALKAAGHFPVTDADDHWWTPSGRSFFTPDAAPAVNEQAEARAHFYLPRRYRDPFGNHSSVDFDKPTTLGVPPYDLLVTETRDALQNQVAVEANDYRVLQPRRVRDPNGNRTEVAFDTLGMVVGTAVMGKAPPAPAEGDTLKDFEPDPPEAQLEEFIARPRRPHANGTDTEAAPVAHELLAGATTRIVYDLHRFRRTQQAAPLDPALWQPPLAATIVRETHVSQLAGGARAKLQVSFSYSDGFGREIQKKLQAEPERGTFADEVLADDPTVFYRFGSSADPATVRDSSRYGLHATPSSNGLTLGVPGLGLGDTAASFGGAQHGRVVIPEHPRLKPKRITLEAVISWRGPNGFQQRIIEKSFSHSSPTWPTYSLSVRPDGSVMSEMVIKGRPGIDVAMTTTKLQPDAPAHVAATFDGSALRIYIDGVEEASLPLVGDIITTQSGPGDIGIGNQVERNRPFNGVIDEVAIYGKALSAARIRAHAAKVADGNTGVRPRWVGSGWTIFNNKGKPVRQYEPFFTRTHELEFGATAGVSPVLFYDPLDRVVATLHPNHTYEKVLFNPWRQTTYDVNDTCAPRNGQTGDPRTDPDIRGYTVAYFSTQPTTWQTWFQRRTHTAPRPLTDTKGEQPERDAAVRAMAHADTPTTAHFDALGRPFLTAAHNRVVCQDHPLHNELDEDTRTRVELDIEGNQRKVLDERRLPDADGLPLGTVEQRIVMRYAYDMLGNRIHQLSMEAGARWMLNDVAGKPIRAWDSRGHNFLTRYDALRRPTEQYVRGTFSDLDPRKPNSDPRTLNPPRPEGLLVDRIEYGEAVAAPAPNLRTRVYRHLDSAGEIINTGTNPNTGLLEAYDFKGNLLRSRRRLALHYMAIPDWALPDGPQLDATEFFESSTRYDALNRPTLSVAPHSNVTRPGHPSNLNITQPEFNDANLLGRLHVWLEQPAEPILLLPPASADPVGVANIDYDAKGQRALIDYKTQDATVIRTAYAYDPLTFRLTHLYTRRGVDATTAQGVDFTGDCDDPQRPPPDTISAPAVPARVKGCGLQNLQYTYDPAGNITRIHDGSQQTVYFQNQRIDPSNDYVYDALYRLIRATGREHLSQSGEQLPHSYNDAGRIRQPHPNSGELMARYCEQYLYDAVGNFLSMNHHRSCDQLPGWERGYAYAEDSLIEPGKRSNRLGSTTVRGAPAEGYRHDVHGNMLQMPQLQGMEWDYRDRLRMTQRQKINEEDTEGKARNGECTWYLYDGSGQRVRKVTERSSDGGIKDERIYLGGFEVFRSYEGAAAARTLGLERETFHLMDDKQRVALVETRTLPRAPDPEDPLLLVRYQLGNHLGSTSLELDGYAQIVSYEEYAPYGSSTYQGVRSRTETAKRYRYTGKERDEESGLYYHGARYCAAWLGRWTSVDPILVGDGPNVYAYCRQSPICGIDKNGTSTTHMSYGKKAEEKLTGQLADAGGALLEREVKISKSSRVDALFAYFKKAGGDLKTFMRFFEMKTMDLDRYVKNGHLDDSRVHQKLEKYLKQAARYAHESGVSTNLLVEFRSKSTRLLEAATNTMKSAIDDVLLAASSGNLRTRVGGKVTNVSDAFLESVKKVQTLGTLKPPAHITLGSGLGGAQEVVERIAGGAQNVAARVRSGASGAAEFLSEKGGSALETSKKALGAIADSPLAKKALKVVPFLGIGAGAASAGLELKSGNRVSAALDAVGLVPVIGDAVDAARLGVELGGELGTWIDKKTGMVDKLGLADAAADAFGGWWDTNINKRFNL